MRKKLFFCSNISLMYQFSFGQVRNESSWKKWLYQRRGLMWLPFIYLFWKNHSYVGVVAAFFFQPFRHKSSSHDFITVTSNQLKKKAKNHNVPKNSTNQNQMFSFASIAMETDAKTENSNQSDCNIIICIAKQKHVKREKKTVHSKKKIRMEIHSLGTYFFSYNQFIKFISICHFRFNENAMHWRKKKPIYNTQTTRTINCYIDPFI